MYIKLVAPFSTNVAFDRKWMAYGEEKVAPYFKVAKEELLAEGISLGKGLLPIATPGRFYLDTLEPGELFREYFLAKTSFELDITDLLSVGPEVKALGTIAAPCTLEWLDRGVGYLTMSLRFEDTKLLSYAEQVGLAEFDRVVNDLADAAFLVLGRRIKEITARLLEVRYIRPVSAHIDEPAALISTTLHWVHKVWYLSGQVESTRLRNVISQPTLSGYASSYTSYWGWGDSIYVCAGGNHGMQNEDAWERGMLLAQYFHTTLDHEIRRLPIQIERTRLLIDRGSVRQAQEEAEAYIYNGNTILTDFEIARQLSAGPTREVMTALTIRWETEKLSLGITSLAPFLRDLIAESSEMLKSWSQTSIEMILFISTVIGFFGLSIALHDYLTPTKERFDISRLMVPQASLSDPIAIAGIFFLISMLVFMLSKVGVILRVVREIGVRLRVIRHVATRKTTRLE